MQSTDRFYTYGGVDHLLSIHVRDRSHVDDDDGADICYSGGTCFCCCCCH